MKLKLIRSKYQFCLTSVDDGVEYKVTIKDTFLLIRTVKLNPQFPWSTAKESDTASNGSCAVSAFNSEHFGLDFLALYMDGDQVHYKPLKQSFLLRDQKLKTVFQMYYGI